MNALPVMVTGVRALFSRAADEEATATDAIASVVVTALKYFMLKVLLFERRKE